MSNQFEELIIPTVGSIRKLLDPIYQRLEKIDSTIKVQSTIQHPNKYYRNQDLKKIFGLSNNTIIKYRETGVLPYTKLGDIYLYDVREINTILNRNRVF